MNPRNISSRYFKTAISACHTAEESINYKCKMSSAVATASRSHNAQHNVGEMASHVLK